MNHKSTKDKFKPVTDIKEQAKLEEQLKVNEKNINNIPYEEEINIDPKEKYKAFKYNLPDEESKKRFEDYNDYSNYMKAIGMHHNSIFKIKNFFVRRNFLARKIEKKNEDETQEFVTNQKDKNEALEKMIDPYKEKILLYETNSNIVDIIGGERKIIKWTLFTTCLNNILILTSFKFLFVNTFTSYLFTYFFNITVFGFFLGYKKMTDDCVMQAEYIPKSKELLILKKNPYNFKVYEEKVDTKDLKFFKSNRIYEKNSKYFVNIKNKKKYAFHENGIWHQEKVFDLILDVRKEKNSNYT